MQSDDKKAVILLSGGLDSATVAAIARAEGRELLAVTFYYNQKHDVEISFARRLVQFFNIKDHQVISINAGIFKSALTNEEFEVPKGGTANIEEIPSTYVPARNILFLSYALAFAESQNASEIFIGANAVDYSGYPDCRPEFFDAFNRVSQVGTKRGVEGNPVKVVSPLLLLKKSEIIKKGLELGVDYSLTHSCYAPHEDGSSCGECDSCLIRKKGFLDADVDDPTRYRKE